MLDIYIDADACPVKEEIYKVAKRYALKVFLVANTWMQTPKADWVTLILVADSADAADDWIAAEVGEGDVVITADIPLAGRCVEKQARVLTPRGKVYTEHSIGEALASRELLNQLRETGVVSGGPRPFDKQDRSHFLQVMDQIIQSIKRGP